MIALIITVIVMLILVGVTVNVALNGNLFKITQEATEKTVIESEKEQLLSSIVASIGDDAKVNFTKLDSNLPTSEWSGTNGTYTSPKENIYTVTENGEINYVGKSSNKGSNVSSNLEKYILGEDGNGRILEDIFKLNAFLDDPTTPDVDETETLGVEFLTEEKYINGFIYVKYDNKAYKIICDATGSKTEGLELIYEPKGTEGQKTADGWTILYDNGSTAEAISPTAMGALGFGYEKGTTDSNEQISQAIESYNNAITTINEYCKNLEGLPTNSGVRSVGAPAETTTTKYSSDELANVNSEYNGVGLEGDINYEQDVVRMAFFNVSQDTYKYWVASRYSVVLNGTDCFGLYYMMGTPHPEGVWWAKLDGTAGARENTSYRYSVRPIITIENL